MRDTLEGDYIKKHIMSVERFKSKKSNITPIGIFIPTIRNPSGLGQLVSSISSSKYDLHIMIKDNNLVNLGCAASWNLGIDWANVMGFTYLMIINDDCLMEQKAIDILTDAIITNKNYTILSSLVYENIHERAWGPIGGEAHYSCFIINLENFKKLQIFEDTHYPINHVYKSCKGDIKLRHGYFDENFFPVYYEDCDMRWRLKLAGLLEGKVTDSLFSHTHMHSAKTSTTHQEDFNLNTNYYKQKWGGVQYSERFTTPFNL